MTHFNDTATKTTPIPPVSLLRRMAEFLARTINEADTIDRGIDTYKSRF